LGSNSDRTSNGDRIEDHGPYKEVFQCQKTKRTKAQLTSHRAKERRSGWRLIYKPKVVGQDTNGAFALSELTAYPEFGPPPHIHHREDESFYILEGQFEFLDNGRTFTASAGAFVYLPKGRLHMHRAAGGAPARALVLVTPAGIEKFIEEAGEPATDVSSPPPPPEMPDWRG
jgi:quercetin dioxygenase-like cupin family protein